MYILLLSIPTTLSIRPQITFSDNYGYFPLILHQNLTSNSFLKVSCIVESETLSMNFCNLLQKYRSLLHFECPGSLYQA